MAQQFDAARYQEEMRSLVADACARFRAEHGDVEVYTVSIWTDADAAASAVCFDTQENSIHKVDTMRQYFEQKRDRSSATGQLQMEAKIATRNYNPADFAFRDFAVVENLAFPALWKEQSRNKCWKVLEPALLLAGEAAMPVLQTLRLHPDAELGVNSNKDWFDHTRRLSANV